jgi:hypothetical protein
MKPKIVFEKNPRPTFVINKYDEAGVSLSPALSSNGLRDLKVVVTERT